VTPNESAQTLSLARVRLGRGGSSFAVNSIKSESKPPGYQSLGEMLSLRPIDSSNPKIVHETRLFQERSS